MLTGINADLPLAETGAVSADIAVRREAVTETSILAAAKAWARALEASQRHNDQSAELALYDAHADAEALRRAAIALYHAVLASRSASR